MKHFTDPGDSPRGIYHAGTKYDTGTVLMSENVRADKRLTRAASNGPLFLKCIL